MNTLLVFALLAITIIIVWVWMLRRRKPDTATIENASSQAADVNPSKAELPESLEAEPTTPYLPQLPSPTSPDAPISVTTEASSVDDVATFSKFAEVQPTPVPEQVIDIGVNDGPEPLHAFHDESPVTQPRETLSLPEAQAPASEPVSELSITNEDLNESNSPAEMSSADTTIETPLSHFGAESDVTGTPTSSFPETEPTPKPPIYHPPAHPRPKPKTPSTPERPSSSTQKAADLPLRVQLVWGRGGVVKTLAVIPDRREGMPKEVDVSDERGTKRLIEFSDDYYEPVPLADASNELRDGIQWRSTGDTRRWRWILSKRQLYVLARGDEFGLHGYVSVARLRLNGSHLILATTALHDQVLVALANAGCGTQDMSDDTTPGVPSGWILFRNVTPTKAVTMRESSDILNILCPVHDIEPHFAGGVRLERNSWLAGFPPRIRFTGDLGAEPQIMIDGEPAYSADDGAFEAPGWDAEGQHALLFADRTETYSLRTMDEGWDHWNAHDFGTGAAICGADIHRIDGTHWHQARVSTTNTLLLGARPGEVFICQTRLDVHSETILALVPFAPVWALPIDAAHADKRSARLVLLDSMEPTSAAKLVSRDRNADRAVREWVAAINGAGRKQLALADESEDAKALWRRYRAVAKRLWKRMR